jgi:hypothetical protein
MENLIKTKTLKVQPMYFDNFITTTIPQSRAGWGQPTAWWEPIECTSDKLDEVLNNWISENTILEGGVYIPGYSDCQDNYCYIAEVGEIDELGSSVIISIDWHQLIFDIKETH